MIIEIIDGILSGHYLNKFISFVQHPMVVAILFYTIGYFVSKS